MSTTEHDLMKARREAAVTELARLGVRIDSGSGVTTEELEYMLAVFTPAGRPDVALLVQRARKRAVDAALDGADCARKGQYDDARSLFAEAAHHVDTAEQREQEEQR